MNRWIAVFLTLLLLMNSVGYFAILFGLQYNNAVQLKTAFDQETYDEEKELVIRLPLSVPYNLETPYQRVDGTFEYRNEFYKLVKQRLVRDTLEIVLLKDDRHKEIHHELVRYHDQNTSHTSFSNTINLIKDYLPQTTDLLNHSEGWEMMLVCKPADVNLLSSYCRLELPPPKCMG